MSSKSPVYIGAGASEFTVAQALSIISDADVMEQHALSASRFAQLTGSTVTNAATSVDTTKYSALEYAQGTTASTGGSAKDYAQKTDGGVSGETGDHSAKAWAVGGTGVTTTSAKGAAKEWASGSGLIDTASYSSKEYAQSTTAGTDTYDGSAKGWASTAYNTAIPGASASDRSSLHYSTIASNSATAAKASADSVASIIDYFNDVYLGSMSDSATATDADTTGTWAINSSVITVASATNVIVGQEVTGSGIPTDVNVIAVDGTSITISGNMAAAGTAVDLDFRGQGVYGAFNGSKDGPAATNDGAALTDGMLYFNTTDDTMKVYDVTAVKWKQLTPTSAEQTNIDAAVADSVDIGKVAAIDTEIGEVAAIDSEVVAVAGDAVDIGKVAAIDTEIANIGTDAYSHATTGYIKLVSDDATDIGAVAGKATEIGLLGTSAMATASTGHLALLGTSAMAHASTGYLKLVGDIDDKVTTLVANISSVTDFASKYRVASSAPGSDNDSGDLYYNTSTNAISYWDGSAWQGFGLTLAQTQTEANNAAVAMSIALG